MSNEFEKQAFFMPPKFLREIGGFLTKPTRKLVSYGFNKPVWGATKFMANDAWKTGTRMMDRAEMFIRKYPKLALGGGIVGGITAAPLALGGAAYMAGPKSYEQQYPGLNTKFAQENKMSDFESKVLVRCLEKTGHIDSELPYETKEKIMEKIAFFGRDIEPPTPDNPEAERVYKATADGTPSNTAPGTATRLTNFQQRARKNLGGLLSDTAEGREQAAAAAKESARASKVKEKYDSLSSAKGKANAADEDLVVSNPNTGRDIEGDVDRLLQNRKSPE